MSEFIQIMLWPLLACLVMAGIHAYLGFHVIERQVIFVDLALAQIAVLGASFALVAGHDLDSSQAYWWSLGFAVLGAAIFSLTRFKNQRVPQEAIIGITFAVSAALLVIILSHSAEGDEHIKQALAGNILLVNPAEVRKLTGIYAVVGLLHFMYRKQFLAISKDPHTAMQQGLNIRGWDFLFYVLFGVVVTSSVKIAGVLLVFAFLVVPSVCALICSSHLKSRLAIGWAVGFAGSILGIAASYYLDFPTGASIVCVLGIILIAIALKKW